MAYGKLMNASGEHRPLPYLDLEFIIKGDEGPIMATAATLPIYDELLDLLVESADADRLMAFRLPAEKQLRLDELLQKNRDGRLTEADRGELDEFERLEHLGRLLKARLRQKQKQ